MTASILSGAAALALVGFHMAFRQRLVRMCWAKLTGNSVAMADPENDPVHHALIIAGIMVMAFGLLIFVFVTAYAAFS